MQFDVNGETLDLDLVHLIVAGWTGRDPGAIRHHIDELADLGVAPPSATPLYYRVSADLLTTRSLIQVVGDTSSGEVEPVIVQSGGQRWLGLGSDHTDRALEAHSVALSKQACAKPCAPELWLWEEVADHLDDIRLESWISEGGEWVPYQAGTLGDILPLADLARDAELEHLAADGATAMLCGTFAAKGGVRPAGRFRMRMMDPTSRREIGHEYTAAALPLVT